MKVILIFHLTYGYLTSFQIVLVGKQQSYNFVFTIYYSLNSGNICQILLVQCTISDI